MPELKACPIETTFRIIGRKWTILILRELFRGVTQFNRLQENIEGINPKMLSLRLKELRRFGIIERKIFSEVPIRVRYDLTKTGWQLGPVLAAAAKFSMTLFPKLVFKDGKPMTPEENGKARIAIVRRSDRTIPAIP